MHIFFDYKQLEINPRNKFKKKYEEEEDISFKKSEINLWLGITDKFQSDFFTAGKEIIIPN